MDAAQNFFDEALFAHGSEWLRADFHLHTCADGEFEKRADDAERFVSRYLDALVSADIRIGVITNHNKFSADEFRILRKAARKRGVCLLPGVELSVNDGANGIHMLVVFGDEWIEAGSDYINPFLSAVFLGKSPAQYEHENGRCNFGLIDVLRKLSECHRPFFCVMAHVEAPSGLWSEFDGGRIGDLAKNPEFQRHVLAFQKVRTHDKPDEKCRVKVKNWLGPAYPAEVEGCDAKRVDEIGRGRKCYLKIGHFGFSAVHDALLDHASRVSAVPRKHAHSHVRAIRFSGGRLDGKRIDLSPHLNCLIGIRGSGKSSVLEALRYGLGLELSVGTPDESYKTKLLKEYFLGSGGKITIEAEDRDGRRFEIRRILGERAEVYLDGELQPGAALREAILRKPLYFGQKDLAVQGDGFGQDLVDKLVGEQLHDVRQRIRQQQILTQESIEALIRLAQDSDKQAEYQSQLDSVQFQLKTYSQYGIEQQLKTQIAYDQSLKRAGDVETSVRRWKTALAEVRSEHESELLNVNTPAPPDQVDFTNRYRKACAGLQVSLQSVAAAEKQAGASLDVLQGLREELAELRNGQRESFAQIERAMSAELAQRGVTSITPDAFRVLKVKEEQLLGLLASLKEKTSRQAQARELVLRALSSLNGLWLEEFNTIKTLINAVNDRSGPLQVGVEFKGDKAGFKQFAQEMFRGSGLRESFFADLVKSYADFAQVHADIDAASTLAGGRAEAFRSRFNEQLKALLVWQPSNAYHISYHGKPLHDHSLGQRAQALSLFILSQNDHDMLIIDQPEDDLDNQTLYAEVISRVRNLKPSMQFVLATHNASFPVLGDAEQVIVCRNEGDMAIAAGSVDVPEIQKAIVDIMEGGREAFERRKEVYQRWT